MLSIAKHLNPAAEAAKNLLIETLRFAQGDTWVCQSRIVRFNMDVWPWAQYSAPLPVTYCSS